MFTGLTASRRKNACLLGFNTLDLQMRDIVLSHAGVGLMSFESHTRPPVSAFPLPALAATDLDDADMRPPNVAAPSGFRGCHYIMAAGRELWHKAYRCVIRHVSAKTCTLA